MSSDTATATKQPATNANNVFQPYMDALKRIDEMMPVGHELAEIIYRRKLANEIKLTAEEEAVLEQAWATFPAPF